MISLLLGIVIVGFICWLLVTLVPMPSPFPQVVIAVACLIVLIWALQSFGLIHGLALR